MGVKVNLCCGDQVIGGWINCDPRTYLHSEIHEWWWGDTIPATEVEIVYVGYGFIYAEKDNYVEYLTQIKDILEDGGRVVIKEDDDNKRVWRKPGCVHDTGVIRSTSNKQEMTVLMEEAGFTVEDGFVDEDIEFLHTHLRAWSMSYILTGWKK